MRVGPLLIIAALWSNPALADIVVITVGPGGHYQRIAEAVAAANADTEIELDRPQPFGGPDQMRNYYMLNLTPGVYLNDFAEVKRPITIQVDPAFPGKKAVLKATISPPNQKAILHTTSSLHVRGLSFIGA